jgi:hypothetical protein
MKSLNSENLTDHHMHTSKPMKAVLFKSRERFLPFYEKLISYGVECTVLDFAEQDWVGFDYGDINLVIYYPSFEYSSNHPLSLYAVYDNLMFIHSEYPHLKIYPDPNVIRYYNDKYRQYLFLKAHKYPIPDSVPLLSESSMETAEKQLGYPMVIKNRFGAGGDSVYMARDRKELKKFYALSTLDLFNTGSARYFGAMLSKRIFYYHLIKAKRVAYPFLSPPLIAQKFITIDRDLKTVVGNYKVIEGHWRIQADKSMWKMNIDGGGIGEWSRVPERAIDLSERLATELKASWLNLDIIVSGEDYFISEFSPVWHHYAYKEKPSFVYKEDYNIGTPLDVSLDLERIIIESLMADTSERARQI